MPVKKTLYVLGPTGQRQEADVIRRALASPDLDVRLGLASAHVLGQAMRGDAVVIGGASAAIEADVTGKVHYVDDLDELERLAPQLLGREPAQAPGGASSSVPEPEPEPEAEPEDEPEVVTVRLGPFSAISETVVGSYNGDDDGEAPVDTVDAPVDDFDAIDAEMHKFAADYGVHMPEGRVTNEGLRAIAEACCSEDLAPGYIKNADLIAMIRLAISGE